MLRCNDLILYIMFGFVGGNEFFCVIRAIRYHIEAALRPERCPIAPYFFFDNLNCILHRFLFHKFSEYI
jgi:hypothetical protein